MLPNVAEFWPLLAGENWPWRNSAKNQKGGGFWKIVNFWQKNQKNSEKIWKFPKLFGKFEIFWKKNPNCPNNFQKSSLNCFMKIAPFSCLKKFLVSHDKARSGGILVRTDGQGKCLWLKFEHKIVRIILLLGKCNTFLTKMSLKPCRCAHFEGWRVKWRVNFELGKSGGIREKSGGFRLSTFGNTVWFRVSICSTQNV